MDYLDLGEFVRAYWACALWSSCDDDDQPLDARFEIDDIDVQARIRHEAQCSEFIQASIADLGAWSAEQAGHDFWLTRNGHGAGFWDRDFGTQESRERLAQSAHAFGSADLYVGDDGRLHA